MDHRQDIERRGMQESSRRESRSQVIVVIILFAILGTTAGLAAVGKWPEGVGIGGGTMLFGWIVALVRAWLRPADKGAREGA